MANSPCAAAKRTHSRKWDSAPRRPHAITARCVHLRTLTLARAPASRSPRPNPETRIHGRPVLSSQRSVPAKQVRGSYYIDPIVSSWNPARSCAGVQAPVEYPLWRSLKALGGFPPVVFGVNDGGRHGQVVRSTWIPGPRRPRSAGVRSFPQ